VMKLNNEDYEGDPTEEEGFNAYDEDGEEIDEELEEECEDEESDLEENDVVLTERKGRRGLFLDDEAEDSGEDGNEDESDAESLNLVQDDDKDSESGRAERENNTVFRKIRNTDILSDDETGTNSYRTPPVQSNSMDLETPNADSCSIASFAGSTHSSASSTLFNTAPRWTPYKERINQAGEEIKPTEALGSAESPTDSQIAKKRLGFEELFDETDMNVEDIDDIVGLCSGKFPSQLASQSFKGSENGGNASHSVESQDTQKLISTQDSQFLETQDTVIMSGNVSLGSGNEQMQFPDSEPQQDSPPILVESSEQGVVRRIFDSDDEEDQTVIKKRKRIISDDETSDEDEAEGDDKKHVAGVEQKSGESPRLKTLFDKKGRLRRDFFENEAELSGSDEEVSEDEDERGLDRLEMEEGDLEDIDENEENDKVGRIYQKVLLDEDQAEIRLFQERFLEDGDLHTDYKRNRQFKWKGLDDGIELSKRDSDSEHEEEEDATAEKWRLQRMEREKWIKENREADCDPEFELAGKVAKESSLDHKHSALETAVAGPSAIAVQARVGPLQPLNTNLFQRNSFLARGDSTLEKMAVFTKKTDDRTGSGAKNSTRNFVFATISPEKISDESEPSKAAPKPSRTSKSNPSKKTKLDRTLQADNRSTIFNLM